MRKSLDQMIPPGCAYARFMDVWVVLTRTRRTVWKVEVRQVVKNMHAIVHGLKMRLALKKTFIGLIRKGFDFLGYQFGALGLAGLAQQTIHNHQQRLLRLDEPSASDQRVEEYVTGSGGRCVGWRFCRCIRWCDSQSAAARACRCSVRRTDAYQKPT
jgi:hypothetical protein